MAYDNGRSLIIEKAAIAFAFEAMSSLRLAVRWHGIYGFKSRYFFKPPRIDS